MKKLLVVLVCHTELDFDGSWNVYEKIQPEIDQILLSVADKTGKKPKITYCLTNAFLSERLDDAFRFLGEGHEVGIHSHLPGSQRPRHNYKGNYAYRFDDQGVLNQDRVAGALRHIAISLGLPAPKTHVSGMFTFHRMLINTLVETGFTVDCSLLPGIGKTTHPASGDFVLADNSRRKELYPYRPDPEDPWVKGKGSIIELSVSGNLGGGNISEQIERLNERLNMGPQVDVFQSFWHHFEFAELGWTKGTFSDAEQFLLECGRCENVVFATASEAAAILEKEGL
jgi:hypothetical protein